MTAPESHRRLVKVSRAWWRAPILIASNWLFQGVHSMGRTERAFRAGVAALLFIGAWAALGGSLASLIFAAIAAHTLQWIFNGQLPVLAKNVGIGGADEARISRYSQALVARASREPSIRAVLAIGSLARRAVSSSSDLDIRVLRKSGPLNGLRASAFVAAERLAATLRGFPLDIYVLDETSNLRTAEKPVMLYERK